MLPGGAPSLELPLGASEVVLQAVQANEAAMRETLHLSRVSVASSGTGSHGEAEVDSEYQCPICLVCSPPHLLSLLVHH